MSAKAGNGGKCYLEFGEGEETASLDTDDDSIPRPAFSSRSCSESYEPSLAINCSECDILPY